MMAERYSIQFGVFEVASEADGLALAGMCYDLPIHEGDIIEAVFQLQPPLGYTTKDVAESERLSFDVVNTRAVHLKIVSMTCHGRHVSRLEPGWSAILHVVGEGQGLVTKSDTLGIVHA